MRGWQTLATSLSQTRKNKIGKTKKSFVDCERQISVLVQEIFFVVKILKFAILIIKIHTVVKDYFTHVWINFFVFKKELTEKALCKFIKCLFVFSGIEEISKSMTCVLYGEHFLFATKAFK